ncbi:LysR family transcriptional regulator [Pseudovibrio sp. Tun.PSC04-5.I4]|uniref:LysR family transcriptional regulator n=1 Tax=Pseudovibrio sp. Tun.PSC04-5.I4 TaxID=1798213 RepID=UPI00088FB0B4|nr:LysR family transcriptional regulator [Pseudovibrio sp. Tun.PSC04-5.I4]SDR40132.1 DNA-binding transcriptional regulator, LysR family [Pseudovibrio sp. Tun.PSC04-5.I4]
MNKTLIERFCRNLDWNLLYTFLVIVEEKGVTRAAKRLLVTQPATTNALKRLENQFDCTLIDRTASEFTLTKAGHLLFEECLEICSGVARIAEVLKDVREEVTGHVSIATATHAESPVIDAALIRFHKAFPKATLSINVATSGDVVTLVKRKAASCGIGLTTAKQSGLNYDLIYRERFALYCGRSSPLYGKADVDRDELAKQPYVTFPTDEPGGEMSEFALARSKLGFNKAPVGRSYHLEELRRMIEIGIGVGPFPIHVAQPFVEMGRLWRIPCIEDLPIYKVALS